MKIGIYMRFLIVLTVTFLGFFSLSAGAQDSPNAKKLSNLVASDLLPYWEVSNFKIVATSDIGDAVSPRRAFRFEAEASPSADLYVRNAQEGPFDLVVPTVGADVSRMVYGVLDLSFKAGVWSGKTTVENPVSGLGQPLDLFVRPTLVLGEKETEKKLADLRSTAVAGAVSATEQEIARLGRNHETDLSKLKREQSAAVAKAEAEAKTRLEKISATYRTKLATLAQENTPLVTEAQAEREKLLAVEKEATATGLAALRHEAAKEMEALRAEQAKKRGDLIEQQRQELAIVETRLATELASLQKQLDMSEEIIALQQTLRASLEKRNIGSQELFVAFEKAIEQRTAFLSRIPKKWGGTLTCKYAGDQTTGQQGFTLSKPARMTINKTRSDGADISLWIDNTNRGIPGVVTWLGDAMAFPLHFNMIMKNSNRIEGYDVHLVTPVNLTQDGSLEGTFAAFLRYGSKKYPAECKIELSS
jgi:hypothetical protein